jgi:hypothetical protein
MKIKNDACTVAGRVCGILRNELFASACAKCKHFINEHK